MFGGYRVVAFTPAGRRRYLEILHQYIARDFGMIDEWQLWVNTDDEEDIAYMRSLRSDPRISVIELPEAGPMDMYKNQRFYSNLGRADTIYLRLDDDIVFIEQDAIASLLSFRLQNPEFLLVFPNIINNAVCSNIHQHLAALPQELKTGPSCTDSVGWQNPQFAETVHRAFIEAYRQGSLDRFRFRETHIRSRFSINAFALLGRHCESLIHDYELIEEPWLTEVETPRLDRTNCIFGAALMVHYAFFPQRPHLDTKPWILETYRKIAATECKR